MVNFSNDASVNLSTKQPIEEYGGLAFLLDNLQDYLPYSILSACGTAIGIIGTAALFFCSQNFSKNFLKVIY